MKKVLAIFLSILMIFTIIPIAMISNAQTNADCEIVETGTTYSSLTSAINASESGGKTIKLLRNCTGTTYVQGTSSYDNASTVIDLNGYTITLNASRWLSLQGRTNYTVTFKNGVIAVPDTISKYEAIVCLRSGSIINFENVRFNISPTSYATTYGCSIVMAIASDATVNFKACEINITDSNSETKGIVGYNGTPKVNYYGTNVNGDSPIFKNSNNIVYSGTYSTSGTLGAYTVASTSTATTETSNNLIVECSHSYVDGICEYCFALPIMMKSGASIRLNEQNGIRFYTKVDTTKIAELRSAGYTVELGTLIAPTDLVTDELTHSIGAENYVDIPYESDTYFEDKTFVGSIVHIKDANICRKFIGRGYIKVTNGENDENPTYYYATQNDNERSLKSVALALQGDTSPEGQALYEANKDLVDGWASAAQTANYNINISNKEKYVSTREITDDADKEDITMILVIGQSNSTTEVGYPCELSAVKNGNRDKVTEVTTTPGKNKVYMAKYGQTITELNDSNDVVTLIENGQIGGYSSALGTKWNELTGEKVVIVQAAVGASGMHEWVKDTTKYACTCGHNNQHYAKAVNQFNACYNALKDNYNIKHSFYIWNQGEHDEVYSLKGADINSKEKYFEAYKSMHEDLLADLPLDFGGINIVRSHYKSNSMYLTVARSAQYRAANELKGCYLASRVFENCTKDDMDQTAEGSYGIHAIQKTYNTIGTDAATNLYNAIIGNNNGLKSIEIITNNGSTGVIKSRFNGNGELVAGSDVLTQGEELSIAVAPCGDYTVSYSVDDDATKVDEFGMPVDSVFSDNDEVKISFSTNDDVVVSSEP